MSLLESARVFKESKEARQSTMLLAVCDANQCVYLAAAWGDAIYRVAYAHREQVMALLERLDTFGRWPPGLIPLVASYIEALSLSLLSANWLERIQDIAFDPCDPRQGAALLVTCATAVYSVWDPPVGASNWDRRDPIRKYWITEEDAENHTLRRGAVTDQGTLLLSKELDSNEVTEMSVFRFGSAEQFHDFHRTSTVSTEGPPSIEANVGAEHRQLLPARGAKRRVVTREDVWWVWSTEPRKLWFAMYDVDCVVGFVADHRENVRHIVTGLIPLKYAPKHITMDARTEMWYVLDAIGVASWSEADGLQRMDLQPTPVIENGRSALGIASLSRRLFVATGGQLYMYALG